MTIPILAHSSKTYSQLIFEKLGRGADHARLIYREWFQTGRITGQDPHFKNASRLFQEIREATDFSMPLDLIPRGHESQTEKFLLKTADGLEIEMVLLPMKAGWTLCLSSQVGCRMGCAFCETGKMGLLRSLSTEEIVAQLYQAKHLLGKDVRNIVFMGMGEPLDNYEAVMKAIEIFTDPHGFAMGPRRITVSTSGLVDQIYKLMGETDPAINLAVSVNSPHDLMRNKLMPVNRSHNMEELKRAMQDYCKHPRRKILVEYVLIKGKTDSLQDAADLATYLEGLKVTVNLIPYNPQSRSVFAAPDEQTIDEFYHYLKNKGYLCFVRGTKGQRIMAACGQLGNKRLKKILAFSSHYAKIRKKSNLENGRGSNVTC